MFGEEFDKTLKWIIRADTKKNIEILEALESIPVVVIERIKDIVKTDKENHYILNNEEERYDFLYHIDSFILYKQIFNKNLKNYDVCWSIGLSKITNLEENYLGYFYKIEDYPGTTYYLTMSPIGNLVLGNGRVLKKLERINK